MVKWRKSQSFEDHLCPRLQVSDLETLDFSSLNHMTRLVAREGFTKNIFSEFCEYARLIGSDVQWSQVKLGNFLKLN
jgi:hypothetical protein